MSPDERTQLSAWMARLADGDRAAFDPLFSQLWPLLRGFSARLLGDPAAGEDVAQQALVRLFARASEFDADRDALSWALGITSWEVRSWRRRQQRCREASTDAPPERADERADPERAAIVRDLDRALLDALDQLGVHDREALFTSLREVRELSVKPATLRKRRQRALDRLRTAWRMIHGTE
ncbi:MAG: sigma-70 family RNA polymerase sigma factor [Nannocystaceae bacterium]|nr:sigma-70 family RNA polymerase sigma factor [Myxococcales bacterium]